jgi:uncharacterized protein
MKAVMSTNAAPVFSPRRLLALDGGGIRGLITIEVLAEMERLLRREQGRPDLVLSDFFDYVAGTSTGAIIATCISLGMPVDRIREFYLANGEVMFDKARLLRRFRYKFEDERLAETLRDVLNEYRTPEERMSGRDLTLGSPALQTLLMLVMRNASTDSPWPVSSNPHAKYNDSSRHDCNLDIPLWQLVRASTAAPTYFPPEVVDVGRHRFVFVDGGVTMYNNPAFLLFLMATMEPYRLQWPAGRDTMLLVSVGTGTSAAANADLQPSEMNLLYNAGSIPSALMYGALNEQDMLCRVFGDCVCGGVLDREIGDLCGVAGPVQPQLFTYARYNVELTRAALDDLDLPNVQPQQVQQLDSIAHMKDLTMVGRSLAERVVRAEHFDRFLNAPGRRPENHRVTP